MSDEQHSPYDAEDTGHLWDGNLRELTNPPPRWWMIGLHASWIFVLIYGLVYPMWPLVNSHTKGLIGWTSIGEYKEAVKELEVIRAPYEARLAQLLPEKILADNELKNYVVASAKVLFGDRCAPCHGNSGEGNPGFPVLVDDDWLYGGTLQQIEASITGGRRSIMPAHGSRLTQQETDALTQYVLALSRGEPTVSGQQLFLEKGCIACHGMDGKGNIFLGAANLTDAIWRFTSSAEGISYTISHGVNDASDAESRNAEMPAFNGKLTPTELKKLAIFVHQLGGGT